VPSTTRYHSALSIITVAGIPERCELFDFDEADRAVEGACALVTFIWLRRTQRFDRKNACPGGLRAGRCSLDQRAPDAAAMVVW